MLVYIFTYFNSIQVENKSICKTLNISFTSEMISDRMMIYLASPNVQNFYGCYRGCKI